MRVAIHPIFRVRARDSVTHERGTVAHLTQDAGRGDYLSGRWHLLRYWICERGRWVVDT